MIEKKTVLVLGVGASKPYGLPGTRMRCWAWWDLCLLVGNRPTKCSFEDWKRIYGAEALHSKGDAFGDCWRSRCSLINQITENPGMACIGTNVLKSVFLGFFRESIKERFLSQTTGL
jgi:hypothetical protein